MLSGEWKLGKLIDISDEDATEDLRRLSADDDLDGRPVRAQGRRRLHAGRPRDDRRRRDDR